MIFEGKRQPLSALLTAKLDAIVWPINSFGVFSTILDLEFLKTFPSNGKKVVKAARDNNLVQGVLFVTKENNGQYILNAPLRRHPQDKLGYNLLNLFLLDLKAFLSSDRGQVLESVGLPILGCSSPDTLDAREVENIYRLNLLQLPQVVHLFEPQ